MDKLTRRSLLRTLAGGALTTLGTVVIARASLAATAEASGALPLPGDLQDRAMRVAAEFGEEVTTKVAQWLNLGIPGIFGNAPFGNGWGNGFGNGGFRNGGFRNGGFRNAPRFRNGGFRNW